MTVKEKLALHKPYPINNIETAGTVYDWLMEESNLNIVPITQKDGHGIDQTMAYKLTATMYSNSDEFYNIFKSGVGLWDFAFKIYLGGFGTIENEGKMEISFLPGERKSAGYIISMETANSFCKYKLVVTAFYTDTDEINVLEV